MSIIFFLKPHYKKVVGLRRIASKKKGKKKVFKVVGKGKNLMAVEVDLKLNEEIRIKKVRKKNETIFIVQFMMED